MERYQPLHGSDQVSVLPLQSLKDPTNTIRQRLQAIHLKAQALTECPTALAF